MRRSRSPERMRTSSRCGPRPVVPRSRSRASRPSSDSTVGGSASYAASPVAARARRRAPRKSGRGGTHSSRAPRRVGRRARRADGPRLQCRRVREAAGHAAQRGVSLAQGGRVRGRQVGAGEQRPHEHAVEVGTAGGRASLHDGEAVGWKTSVWTRDRNSSAEDTAAPLSRIRFASRAETRTSVSTWTSPRRPETRAEPSVEP